MKKIILVIILATLISCKKDKEIISDQKVTDPLKVVNTDSAQVATIEDPASPAAFNVIPQEISPGTGKSVFTRNGKTLFYFEQNSNAGKIKIDGKDYALNSYDFNENNYTISGDNVKIEAANGDFKDQNGDCMQGSFPAVKITFKGKVLNLPDINVQDCPDY